MKYNLNINPPKCYWPKKKGVSQNGQTRHIIGIRSYCVLDRPVFEWNQVLLHPELTLWWSFLFVMVPTSRNLTVPTLTPPHPHKKMISTLFNCDCIKILSYSLWFCTICTHLQNGMKCSKSYNLHMKNVYGMRNIFSLRSTVDVHIKIKDPLCEVQRSLNQCYRDQKQQNGSGFSPTYSVA